MRLSSLAAIAALALLSAGPAMASAPATAGQPAAPANASSHTTTAVQNTAPDPDEVVCKRAEIVGSRIPGRKECHTRRDWDQMAADARDSVNNYQNSQDMGSPLAGK